MENNKKIPGVKASRVAIGILVLSLIFWGGFWLGQSSQSQEKLDLDFSSLIGQENVDISLVEDVYNLINQSYVGDVDKEALIYGAIRGMVDQLDDPHSVFFDSDETSAFLNSLSGNFEGVGIEIGLRDDMLTVITPLRDTPAYNAGLLAGDKIVAIDGESTEGITTELAASKIRGQRGTNVVLTVNRDGREIDFTITRDVIEINSVMWEVTGENVAYIEVLYFSDTTKSEFRNAAQGVLDSGADKIVLDLRNNPGGFLDAGVDVAGWFIEEGELVLIEESGDKLDKMHTSPGPASLKDFPIAVLINEGSASASEILAGALRDINGALLVGETSFGKGSVQVLEDLSGNTSLKLTIAYWVTPSGHHINGTGLTPDVVVERTLEDINAGEDPQKQRAIELLD